MENTLENISEIYSKFPEKSKAKEADNHWAFKQFIEDSGKLGKEMFDNAILCLDRNTLRYTWHILCSQYPLSDIKFKFSRELSVEPKLEQLRHRSLECKEVVTKLGEHYFLVN